MKTIAVVVGVVSVIVSVIIVGLGSYISAHNYGVATEATLNAAWQNNQNVLGQYTLKIQEAVQVPKMYADQFKDVLRTAMEGRYGADGSKAAFQWIQENNLQFDSASFNKMQVLIESGRNEFQREQTRMIDIKRTYETNLGYAWKGFWLGLAGFPRVDMDKYRPVVAGDTSEVFSSGVQKPIQLQ